MSFGDRLRFARKLREVGSRALGRIAGVTIGTISKLESGAQPNVTTDVANRLAKALKVSRLWLCWGDGDPVEPTEMYIDIHYEEKGDSNS